MDCGEKSRGKIKTMKKLMIAAAVAAMSVVGSAATFKPGDCSTPDELVNQACPVMVFKLTASGKTVQDVNEGEYKAVSALKISKGALALQFDECAAECASAEASCCYATANIYAQVKVGKKTTKVGILDVDVTKWSVFGKKFEQAANWETEIKKGKSVKLESDLAIAGDGVDVLAIVDETEEAVDSIVFNAVAFGNFTCKVQYSEASENDSTCVPTQKGEVCEATWTPGKYNGWFVGTRELGLADFACFNCDCGDADLFGGTWKATFQKKYVTDAEAQKLALGAVMFGLDF